MSVDVGLDHDSLVWSSVAEEIRVQYICSFFNKLCPVVGNFFMFVSECDYNLFFSHTLTTRAVTTICRLYEYLFRAEMKPATRSAV